MILADKIMSLRKKAGWSQEELAEQLGVTRQSVSKWEGAQSVPDMDKVVQMSRLFGVTTDLPAEGRDRGAGRRLVEESPLRRVTMGQAADYLAGRRAAAPKVAFAVLLCIVSPSDVAAAGRHERGAALPYQRKRGGGHRIVRDAGAAGCRGEHFPARRRGRARLPLLEEEPFETEYGVTGMVRQRQREYADTRTRIPPLAWCCACWRLRAAVRRLSASMAATCCMWARWACCWCW